MNFCDKTIEELKDKNFEVPSFQRGYRWEEEQVEDLLHDIAEFTPKPISKDKDKETFYCIQPVVVKKENDKYILIDGQQRLTTIFLILNYPNLIDKNNYEFISEDIENERIKLKYYNNPLFNITYESRQETSNSLKSYNKAKENSAEEIDAYYILKAYERINKFFKEELATYTKGDKSRFCDIDAFLIHLKQYVRIIWYEINENQDIHDVYNDLNDGKIKLFDSELIKSLFLKKSHFKDKNEEIIKYKQYEIAREWDMIEQALQNDGFWFFLSNNRNKTFNRIDLLLDIIAKYHNEENNTKEINKRTRITFDYFNNKLNSAAKSEETEDLWKEIRECYYLFKGWYKDFKMYHIIGFLLSINDKDSFEDLYTLYKEFKDEENSKELKTKKDFQQFIVQKIKENFSDYNLFTNDNGDIEKLEKGSKYTKSILLLHNIMTMLSNELSIYRFPFDKYKLECWHEEHILPVQQTEPPKSVTEIEKWVEAHKDFYPDEIKLWEDIKQKNSDAKTLVGSFNEHIFQELLKNECARLENQDRLGNIVLLDSQTNISYGNALFRYKRHTIIDKDKKNKFIPICTRNAFLGYYSESGEAEWNENTAQRYEEDIKKLLSKNPFENNEE